MLPVLIASASASVSTSPRAGLLDWGRRVTVDICRGPPENLSPGCAREHSNTRQVWRTTRAASSRNTGGGGGKRGKKRVFFFFCL